MTDRKCHKVEAITKTDIWFFGATVSCVAVANFLLHTNNPETDTFRLTAKIPILVKHSNSATAFFLKGSRYFGDTTNERVHITTSLCFTARRVQCGIDTGLMEACSLRKYQNKSINYVINSTFRKIFNTKSQETVDVCLKMFGCLQAERTIAIRKRKFLNKFSVNITHCAGYSCHC